MRGARLVRLRYHPADPSPGYSSQDPLLGDLERDADDEGTAKVPEEHQAAVSLLQLVTAPELRVPLIIVCFSMLCQQLSGMANAHAYTCMSFLTCTPQVSTLVRWLLARGHRHQISDCATVLYYSNDILSKALPDLGPYISLGITIVNVIMTFPPIFLIEVRTHNVLPFVHLVTVYIHIQRLGRKTLLALSATGGFISLVGVGYGLDSGLVAVASVTILTFVAYVRLMKRLFCQHIHGPRITGRSRQASALSRS